MKKKLLFGAHGALFLGAGIFTATNLQEKEQISDLTLANIEAMTGAGADTSWVCTGNNGRCERIKCGVCGTVGTVGRGQRQGSHSCYFN